MKLTTKDAKFAKLKIFLIGLAGFKSKKLQVKKDIEGRGGVYLPAY